MQPFYCEMSTSNFDVPDSGESGSEHVPEHIRRKYDLTAEELHTLNCVWSEYVDETCCSTVGYLHQLLALLSAAHIKQQAFIVDLAKRRFAQLRGRVALADFVELVRDCKFGHAMMMEAAPQLGEDVMEAFVAVGGNNDTSGAVSKERVMALKREFRLLCGDEDVDWLAGLSFWELAAELHYTVSDRHAEQHMDEQLLSGKDPDEAPATSFKEPKRVSLSTRGTAGIPYHSNDFSISGGSMSLLANPPLPRKAHHVVQPRPVPVSQLYRKLSHLVDNVRDLTQFRARAKSLLAHLDRTGAPIHVSRTARRHTLEQAKHIASLSARLHDEYRKKNQPPDVKRPQKPRMPLSVAQHEKQDGSKYANSNCSSPHSVQRNRTVVEAHEDVQALSAQHQTEEPASPESVYSTSSSQASYENKNAPEEEEVKDVPVTVNASSFVPSSSAAFAALEPVESASFIGTAPSKEHSHGSLPRGSLPSSRGTPRRSSEIPSVCLIPDAVRWKPAKPQGSPRVLRPSCEVGGVLVGSTRHHLSLLPHAPNQRDNSAAPSLPPHNLFFRMSVADKKAACSSDDYGLSRNGFDKRLYRCYYNVKKCQHKRGKKEVDDGKEGSDTSSDEDDTSKTTQQLISRYDSSPDRGVYSFLGLPRRPTLSRESVHLGCREKTDLLLRLQNVPPKKAKPRKEFASTSLTTMSTQPLADSNGHSK